MKYAMSRAVDGLAIVVTVAAIGLWVRSYHAVDRYGWSVRPAGSPAYVTSRTIETTPGRLVVRDYSGFM